MIPFKVMIWIASLGIVLWVARRIPLKGALRFLVVACRLLSVSALCLSLSGWSCRAVHEQSQRVIYLVDRSASMDERQTAWIARRIASLESLRPKQVEHAVMAFANAASVVVPWGHESLGSPEDSQRALMAAPINRTETNVEAALLSAAGLLPSGHGGHVVLFSDGWETSGNVASILGHLRHLGLKVFPDAVPTFGPITTRWEKLSVPPSVQRGSPVGLQLVLNSQSTEPQPAVVTISLSGIPIKRQRVAVRPGWQVVNATVPAIQQGTMALEVSLEIPGQGFRERRLAYTEVEGPPHVLLVDDQPTALPLLAGALRQRDMDVSLARPSDLPAQATSLLDYDAVLLFGLAKSSLSSQQVDALHAYLESFGGGLVMVGLGGDLAKEVATPAPLDALLPVSFEAKGLQEAKRRVCMILLIDRSASMLGPRIAATKRAAVELINQLSPEDLVGVFAFDTKPYVVAEVQSAGDITGSLIEKLVKLRSSGGTDIYPALKIAQGRLNQTDATLKHIILLSDGNTPFQRELYHRLTEEFRHEGISVSTIGIGIAFVNVDYLEWLASSTGGTFYQLRSLEELPHLIAQDTQEALGKLPFTEGYFRPTRNPASEWFTDIPAWPVLRGYLTTTAKPGAQVDLTVQAGETPDPLLARWTLGQGRVVTFTSDADTRWSPDWIRWPGFEGWAAQVVRWAMRPRLSEELFVWVDEHHGTPQLVIEGSLDEPRAELVATSDTTALPLSLIQTQRWRWTAALQGIPSGWYALTLESGRDTARTYARRWVQVGTPPAAHEVPGQAPREAFLRQLADATSGAYGVTDFAFVPPTTTVTTQEPLLTVWLPLVIILFFVDIALRGSTMV